MKVHIQIEGNQAKPLVFFHGWGFDSTIWKPLLTLLSPYYRLYLVDLPGFGNTPLQSWDSFKQALLSRLPRHFSFIGWSLGGLLATRFALEETDRIQSLINLCSSPCFIRKPPSWPGIDKSTFESFFTALLAQPQETLMRFMAIQHVPLSILPSITPSGSLEGLQQGLQWLLTLDLREALQTLTIPTAYFFGRLDTIVPRTTMQAMKRHYPQFEYLMFEQTGHAPFLSHPSSFIAALRGFLQ